MNNARKSVCSECKSYGKDGRCYKWIEKGIKPVTYTREDFSDPDFVDDKEFIPVEKICRVASIFGNNFIGLSDEDIERLKNGEVVHVGGEYGIFIGYTVVEKIEVVRCYQCKYWKDKTCTNVNGARGFVPNQYWYCASGERK